MVKVTITIEADGAEPAPLPPRPVCRAHRVSGCFTCAANQCTHGGMVQCILPAGHKPDCKTFEHNYGGLSPESVWLPAYMWTEAK